MEQPLYRARVARGDPQRRVVLATDQLGQPFVSACGHLAQVRDTFEGDARIAEPLQDVVLHLGGYHLGVGAAAIEDTARHDSFGATAVNER
jgi:hypothetical protein